MPELSRLAAGIRAKNAGPFWVTIDVFFDSESAFLDACAGLRTRAVAERLNLPEDAVKRFELPDIFVIKFSFVRPVVQGSREDRDMHGAQYAWLLADIELESAAAC